MDMLQKLENELNRIPNRKLALFIVSCHVDKPLEEYVPDSKYNIPIQAGAANTDLRTQVINDYDDVEDTISALNMFFSELTVYYWIWRYVNCPYVGVSHYRRRFDITDEALDILLDKGTDIIAIEPSDRTTPIRVELERFNYGYDVELILDCFREIHPEEYEGAVQHFSQNMMYPCCIGIYKKEIFHELCEWLFPVLFLFFDRRVEKIDLYQRRDVSFLAERLISYFFASRIDVYNIETTPMYAVKSKEWNIYDDCDPTSEASVVKGLAARLERHDILKWAAILAHLNPVTPNIKLQKMLREEYLWERSQEPCTFFERMPELTDYTKLVEYGKTFVTGLLTYISNPSEEMASLFIKIYTLQKHSIYSILAFLQVYEVNQIETYLLIAEALFQNGLSHEGQVLTVICLEQYPDQPEMILSRLNPYLEDEV